MGVRMKCTKQIDNAAMTRSDETAVCMDAFSAAFKDTILLVYQRPVHRPQSAVRMAQAYCYNVMYCVATINNGSERSEEENAGRWPFQ